eukprot:TRINITY_DN3836_c0_g1_i1.p1 TRINITY_DN3836_c0_g1~~TRINITY_DN3836_c0_g1_i1.p1  ORF type:complete len:125 (-),score=37.29 TRINITY_DN3836_c0_g1_i1:251-625(-)
MPSEKTPVQYHFAFDEKKEAEQFKVRFEQLKKETREKGLDRMLSRESGKAYQLSRKPSYRDDHEKNYRYDLDYSPLHWSFMTSLVTAMAFGRMSMNPTRYNPYLKRAVGATCVVSAIGAHIFNY